MFLNFIFGLDTSTALVCLFCILTVCFFEFINGFHDTANAVATVIYTNSMKPLHAVVLSGIANFAGVWLGGIAVAMGVVKLLPVNDLLTSPLAENLVMIFAVLITAIAWNLGTWYYGIPCSSSHTLIGALLGAGFAFSTNHEGADVNWGKAQEIGLALLVSPVFGFMLALFLMLIMRLIFNERTAKNAIVDTDGDSTNDLFQSPEGDKKPPMWIRILMIGTSTGVSFGHGMNDGQKGVGLMLAVLIAFLPLQFTLNPDTDFNKINESLNKIELVYTANASKSDLTKEMDKLTKLRSEIAVMNPQDKATLIPVRKHVKDVVKHIEKLEDDKVISKKDLKEESEVLKKTYEFAPSWIIALISISLGLGTMIGWKRVAVTIGEKIGNTKMNYAQGISSGFMAAATIILATQFKAPVSTTHVLSSAIAGSMVAEGGKQNLQRKTVMNILLAWVLTLPVSFGGAFLLYKLFHLIAGF